MEIILLFLQFLFLSQWKESETSSLKTGGFLKKILKMSARTFGTDIVISLFRKDQDSLGIILLNGQGIIRSLSMTSLRILNMSWQTFKLFLLTIKTICLRILFVESMPKFRTRSLNTIGKGVKRDGSHKGIEIPPFSIECYQKEEEKQNQLYNQFYGSNF